MNYSISPATNTSLLGAHTVKRLGGRIVRRISMLLGLLCVSVSLGITAAPADDFKDASNLYQQGKLEQAMAKTNAGLAVQPKDAQGRFLKGLILTEQKKITEAIQIFTGLTEDYPELPEPYNNLAVLYAGQGNYDKAKAALELAIQTHPAYATAHENLGDTYAQLARRAYDKALQLDKTNVTAQSKLAVIKEMFSAPKSPALAASPQTPPPTTTKAGPTNTTTLPPVASVSKDPPAIHATDGSVNSTEQAGSTKEADTILIGQSAALSGSAEAMGKEMRAGAEAYFNAINKAGGVNGKKIRLVTLGDGYEAERAKANTQELIEKQKVLALFGYVGINTSNAALPLFTAAKVPFVGAVTGAQTLREPHNPLIFNVRASYIHETEAIVAHLVRLGITRIGVFYQNDSYGQAGLAGVERALKSRGMEVAAKATVERNSVDVAKAVDTIAKANVTAVIQISAYKSCAAFIQAMRRTNQFPAFWNVSFVGSKALASQLGEDGRGVHISQVVPFPWSIEHAVVREYQQRIGGEANYSFTSLEGYIAAKVLVEGLRKAGKDLNRETLRTALEKLGTIDLGGFTVNYRPGRHQGSTLVDLTIISKNGTFKR